MKLARLLLSCLAPLLATAPALAQEFVGQHRDVAAAYEVDPTQPAVKKLVSGAFDWDAPLNEENLFFGEAIDSVFRTVTSISSDAIFSNTPGFVAFDPEVFGLMPLENGTELAFDAKRIPELAANLSYWSGSGAVSFGPVPSCEAVGIQSPSCNAPGCPDAIVIEGEDRDEPGFPISSVSNGSMHSHLEYFLLGPPEEPTQGCPPASTPPQTGIYLWSLALKSEGFEDSDPTFTVMGTPGITSGQLDEAQQWVAANLVPEPTGTALTAAVLASLACLRAVRRRAEPSATR